MYIKINVFNNFDFIYIIPRFSEPVESLKSVKSYHCCLVAMEAVKHVFYTSTKNLCASIIIKHNIKNEIYFDFHYKYIYKKFVYFLN